MKFIILLKCVFCISSDFAKTLYFYSQNGTDYTPFMEAARQGNEHVFNAFLRDVPVSTKY